MSWWEYINQNAIAICIILSILCIVFIVIGHEYRESVQLLLKRDFIKLPATTIDWWSISHLIVYGIFGFLLPNYHATFLLLGTGFEIFEDALCSDENTQLVDCKNNKSHLMCLFSRNNDYWYGKWDDVFINLLGYTVGSSLRTTFIK
jgi:hypothetical protein